MQNRTARIGLPVQYTTASTALPGQDYGAGVPGQDCLDMTAGDRTIRGVFSMI
jgi:hypothetical protein